jgi:NADH-quinone oxidoreductase subunit A
MFQAYFPILILLVVVLAFLAVVLGVSEFVGRARHTRGKANTYECGMEPIGTARGRFSVKFYLVAVFFILFDIEAVFMIPWAVNLRELTQSGAGPFLLAEMAVFVAILALGLAYVWRKGGLEWNR